MNSLTNNDHVSLETEIMGKLTVDHMINVVSHPELIFQ